MAAARAENLVDLETSAEGSSREDAFQSAIELCTTCAPKGILTPQQYAETIAKIRDLAKFIEARARRKNGRHRVIKKKRTEEFPFVEPTPDQLRAAISREAVELVRAALPRDEHLHQIFDWVLPSEGKPAHFGFRETARIAEYLGLPHDVVARHKETIVKVARRVLSESDDHSGSL